MKSYLLSVYFSEFSFLLDSIATDLPDELMSTSDSTQNGPSDAHSIGNNLNPQDSASQRHQQLSQLLSSSVPTPSSGTTSSISSSNVNVTNTALSNAVKSPTPISNSLQSPPHGLQNKTGPPASSHFLLDGNNFVSSSSSFSLASSSSSTLSASGSIPMPNSLSSMPKNMLNPMSTMPQHNVNSLGLQQNQMMNGPPHSMGGVRQQVHGMVMPSAGNSMPQGMGMSQSNMIGAMNNPQMSRQTLDHAGLMQNSPQQMMKVIYHRCLEQG